mmetsp:Transcript_80410/g.260569  ORF Transcript_80410/g.260569 Transcript_80410/m.260569 type:complete len:321 (-) Transcript_80410:53-1015(-)
MMWERSMLLVMMNFHAAAWHSCAAAKFRSARAMSASRPRAEASCTRSLHSSRLGSLSSTSARRVSAPMTTGCPSASGLSAYSALTFSKRPTSSKRKRQSWSICSSNALPGIAAAASGCCRALSMAALASRADSNSTRHRRAMPASRASGLKSGRSPSRRSAERAECTSASSCSPNCLQRSRRAKFASRMSASHEARSSPDDAQACCTSNLAQRSSPSKSTLVRSSSSHSAARFCSILLRSSHGRSASPSWQSNRTTQSHAWRSVRSTSSLMRKFPSKSRSASLQLSVASSFERKRLAASAVEASICAFSGTASIGCMQCA